MGNVAIGRIDPSVRDFEITPRWMVAEALLRSIVRAGVLMPLEVSPAGAGHFSIVDGFGRYWVARRAGLTELPVRIQAVETIEAQYRLRVERRLGTRPLSELEKGFVLSTLQRRFHVREDRLIEEVLPWLDIAASRFQLQRHLKMAKFSSMLERDLSHLDLETLLKAERWPREDLLEFLRVVDQYRLGRNKQRELGELLDELRDFDGRTRSLAQLWGSLGLDALESQEIPAPQKFQHLIDRLRSERFPRLVGLEQRAADLKKSLRLPPSIQLHHPPYFEGESIRIHFSVRNVREFETIVDRLKDIKGSQELAELLALL